MARFKLLQGSHSEPDAEGVARRYKFVKGGPAVVVESQHNLVEMFGPERFEKLPDELVPVRAAAAEEEEEAEELPFDDVTDQFPGAVEANCQVRYYTGDGTYSVFEPDGTEPLNTEPLSSKRKVKEFLAEHGK